MVYARILTLALVAAFVATSVFAADRDHCMGFSQGDFYGPLELDTVAASNTAPLRCQGERVFADTGSSETNVGWETTQVGDVNGDGYGDYAVASIGDSYEMNGETYYTKGSSIYIVFGSGSFSTVNIGLQADFWSWGYKINNDIPNSRCGYSLAGIGDFNGDNIDDFSFGCDRVGYTAGYPITNPGATYVVYGNADWGVSTYPEMDMSELDASSGIEFLGGTTSDNLGVSVAGGSDLNGDTFPDLVLGALTSAGDVAGKNQNGAVYVVWGTGSSWSTFTTTLDDATLSGGVGIRITNDQGWQLMGHSVKLSDNNGDGNADIIVGAPRAPYGDNAGYVWVIYGGATVWETSPWILNAYGDGSQYYQIQGPALDKKRAPSSKGLFGTGLDVGDVNDDGIEDIVASSPKVQFGGDNSGSFFVIYGSSVPRDYDSHRIDLDILDTNIFVRFDGAEGDIVYSDLDLLKQSPNDIAVADFNYDNIADIAYGAYNANGVGSVSVIYGAAGWDTSVNVIKDWVTAGSGSTINGVDQEGARCGWSVGVIGEKPYGHDILIGCPGANQAFRVYFEFVTPAPPGAPPAVVCPSPKNPKNLVAYHDADNAFIQFERRSEMDCERIKARVLDSDQDWVVISRCGTMNSYVFGKKKIMKKLEIDYNTYATSQIEWKVKSVLKATEECPDKLKSSGRKVTSSFKDGTPPPPYFDGEE